MNGIEVNVKARRLARSQKFENSYLIINKCFVSDANAMARNKIRDRVFVSACTPFRDLGAQRNAQRDFMNRVLVRGQPTGTDFFIHPFNVISVDDIPMQLQRQDGV